MRQKSEQETMAAERHISLLVDALEKAKANGGVWLNPDGCPRPKMYSNDGSKGINVSPFNALVMALHTDAGEHKMPLYFTFNMAKDNDLSVMKGQKGVPFIWYNWDTFVNRDNPDDKISRETYKALPESVKENYKAQQRREVRTVFNIDQTTFSHAKKQLYDDLQKEYGNSEVRGEDPKGLKMQVNHFLLTMRDNLVRVQHSGDLANAKYDPKRDTVFIPNEKSFPQYADYAQDTIRQIMLATGYEQRLARVSRPTQEAIRQEALVSELSAGIKMAELGLPAKISKENIPHIDYWKQELQANPCLIDILERDVNNSLDIVSKAERGEKVEYASKQRQDLVKKLTTPDINSQECAILLDIIRREGVIDSRNFKSDAARRAFIEKFDLNQFQTEVQSANAKLATPGLSEAEYEKAKSTVFFNQSHITDLCSANMPEVWNDKSHNFFIHQEITDFLSDKPKLFGLVIDNKTKIADVILPTGANIKEAVSGSHNIDRIEHAVKKYKDASYVRFFNADGFMGFKPDDNYFQNKKVSFQSVKGWNLELGAELQINNAVLKANTVVFDQAQMMKDDNGKWALYLKPLGEDGFALHPDTKDLNQFFTTLKHGDKDACDQLRNELSQKYYLVATAKPKLKFDIFGMDASQEDIDRISHVSIFRTKDSKLMLMPTIQDVGKQRPREITQQQWQRLWLAEDMAAYKTHLAAKLFADVLHPDVELAEGEKVSAKDKVNSEVDKNNSTEKTVKAKNSERENPEIKNDSKSVKESVMEDVKNENDVREENKADKTVNLDGFKSLKAKHPDAVLLFRTDDKYESYMQDAETCSKVLGIEKFERTDSKTGKSVAMTEFPYHQLDTFLPKLVRSGNRVAICDQLEPVQKQEQNQQEQQSEAQEETKSRGMRR